MMEYRNFGKSGLKIPVLSLGTGTFGGTTEFFQRWGETDEKEATRLVDICLERGINFFDTANVYSLGASETILGKAIKHRRDKVILSTKATFAMGEGPNDKGASRYHILKAFDDSLQRLGADYIDVFFMHGFDAATPLDETLYTLDTLVKSGKVRYIGCSNFTGWQLMKSLSVSEQNHFAKFVVYQGYYSLIGRDYELELMPLFQDQGMSLMAWSPLGWGRLTGKIKRKGIEGGGRIQSGGVVGGPPVSDEHLYTVIDALEDISAETGKTVAQVAINWLLQKQTVCNVVIGARNEQQLMENIEAVGWSLSDAQVSALDAVTTVPTMYPHWVGKR
jgi:aryl-alcohol dehydrogenase-like predicted oxidoreductase